MKKKSSLILDDEFVQYCQMNNIDDVEKLAKETFNRGFAILKYGETPVTSKNVKVIEKEIIKEVPVEKIVEIIKEVEVPVNTETTIVKEVFVDNKEHLDKLVEENTRLKTELDKINKSLEALNKAKYMKNSDMSSLYGE